MSNPSEIFITENIFLVKDEESLKDKLLYDQLLSGINYLINNDFERLITLLYRIDVNEQKLKVMLRENESEDAAKIIAGLIIDRQVEKIRSRKNSDTTNADIPEDEKW